MDLETARWLVSDESGPALRVAAGEADPGSLVAGERLRALVGGDQAAAVLNQIALRRRAGGKLGPVAADMWLTSAGLEQATRWRVATWRAAMLRAAGVARVVDLGCGIGVDALACARAGLDVIGVERDPVTAVLAAANLKGVGRVGCGSAEDVVTHVTIGAGSGVEAGIPGVEGSVDGRIVTDALGDPATAVFIDPARRTGRGRSWDVTDLSPSWEFVSGLLAADRLTVVKLGPGFPDALIPDGVLALWVSDGGDLVECSLWSASLGAVTAALHPADPADGGETGCRPGVGSPDLKKPTSGPCEWGESGASPTAGIVRPGSVGRRAAILLPDEHLLGATRRPAATAERLPVPGDWLYEPDPAVARAGATDDLAAQLNAGRIATGVPYLLASDHRPTPFATAFRIVEVHPWDERALKRWAAERAIGTLEIKKRAVDADPATLRKRLRLRGNRAATIVITPTVRHAAWLVVERT